jgi:antitoxin ParD1/3/4
MQIHLSKELEEFIQQLIKSGVYEDASEVVHDALWLLRDRAALHKIKLEELRQLIAVGIEQADRGELIDGELVFAKLQEKIRQRGEQAP